MATYAIYSAGAALAATLISNNKLILGIGWLLVGCTGALIYMV